MYLDSVDNLLLSNIPNKTINPKYIAYFHDLHHFAGGFLDSSMLLNESGYTFHELFEFAIKQDKNIVTLLKNIDLCVFIHASYEYDSRYSHIGAYLKDHYQLPADIFDIFGQGSCDVVSAFHLIFNFFEQKNISNALIFGFAQTALPLRVSQFQKLPDFNGLGYIHFLSDITPHHGIKIIESDFLTTDEVLNRLSILKKTYLLNIYLMTNQSDSNFLNRLLCHRLTVFPSNPEILEFFNLIKQIKKNNIYLENALHIILIESLSENEWGMIICHAN